MEKLSDWIRTYGLVFGVLVAFGTFSYNSCATRWEMNARFDEVNRRLDEAHTHRNRIEDKIDNVENKAQTHRNRIEDKVEQLNQNYIEHLVHHNEKP